MNKLIELKSIEKELITDYKASFQGNFCNSKFMKITASHEKKSKESAASLNNLNLYKTPTRKEKKAHSVNDIEYSSSKNHKTSQPGSMNSLNELDLELQATDMKYEELSEVKYNELNMSEKAKATSLAYIQEERDEEERSVERTPNMKAKKYAAASMNEIQSARKNLNENLYQEAKMVIRGMCVKKTPMSQRYSPTVIIYFYE